MKKIMFGSVPLLFAFIGSIIFVQNRQAIAAIPDIQNPNIVREAPSPVFPDNSRVPQSSLRTQAQILSTRVLPDNARNISLQLTTWGGYATSREVSVEFPATSQARQVWVLKDQYAEYFHPRLGLMRNAQVTSVFDAETGKSLASTIVGTPSVSRDDLVFTPVVGP